MAGHLSNLRIAFAQVFSSLSGIAVAAALAVFAFVLAVWLPNVGLMARVYSDSGTPVAATLALALSLLGGIGTNFSLLAAGYTMAIAVLFGLVIAMIRHQVMRRRSGPSGQGIAAGSGGALSGVLGIGCAACGSLVAGLIAPALGAVGGLAALPLQGEEFGLASVALLLASLLLVSRNIAESSGCASVTRPACERGERHGFQAPPTSISKGNT